MTHKLRKEIKRDIKRIDDVVESGEGGKLLYETLVAKYSSYDSQFTDGLPCLPVIVLGKELPKYKNNLVAVKGKLQLLLTTNCETRFYKKEGFVSGVLTGVISSVIASGICALVSYLINLI